MVGTCENGRARGTEGVKRSNLRLTVDKDEQKSTGGLNPLGLFAPLTVTA